MCRGRRGLVDRLWDLCVMGRGSIPRDVLDVDLTPVHSIISLWAKSEPVPIKLKDC